MTSKPPHKALTAVRDRVLDPVHVGVDENMHSIISSSTLSSTHPSTRTSTHPSTQTSTESLTRPSTEQLMISSSEILTVNQALIYYCLKWLGGQPTTVHLISKVTAINIFTIRSALLKMRRSGHIRNYGGMINLGGHVGFFALVNDGPIHLRGNKQTLVKKLKNLEWSRLLLARSLQDFEEDHELDQLLDHNLDNLIPSPLSSSRISNNSTTEELRAQLERHLEHPEMAYWKDRGMTVAKMEAWIVEFRKLPLSRNMKPENLFLNMCYCAWDMVKGEREATLDKTAESYFYGSIKKNGYYFKPNDYVSWEDNAIQQLKQQEKDYLERYEKRLEIEALELIEKRAERTEDYNRVLKAMRKDRKYIPENTEGPMFKGTFIETYKMLKKETLQQHSIH